jgi:hypothetical protein
MASHYFGSAEEIVIPSEPFEQPHIRGIVTAQVSMATEPYSKSNF